VRVLSLIARGQEATFHIDGKTPTGRATVAALNMNRLLAIAIRRAEIALGRHPQMDF